ncbi:MAG: alanyl-tRNA editing protein [Candidatus Woesearchaeota archaeon]|nr:alanyl-tRNA editing protein [Candidatus Woesearchaeota archaeon]
MGVDTMTKKLYHQDPHQEECTAKVTNINSNDVEVDQTIFFAFAGGQASDTGTINNIPVTEAKKAGKNIIYTLEETPPFAVGDTVTIQVDKEKRERIIKLHSAIHFAYFLLTEKIGQQKLIGSNVTDQKARADFAYDGSFAEILPELQEQFNELIKKNVPVRTFPSDSDPEKRIWESHGWTCPCGGTHVASTGEIGSVILKRKTIGAGKERLEVRLA